jgi:hypothetical protein
MALTTNLTLDAVLTYKVVTNDVSFYINLLVRE